MRRNRILVSFLTLILFAALSSLLALGPSGCGGNGGEDQDQDQQNDPENNQDETDQNNSNTSNTNTAGSNSDTDGDGIVDDLDNCPTFADPSNGCAGFFSGGSDDGGDDGGGDDDGDDDGGGGGVPPPPPATVYKFAFVSDRGAEGIAIRAQYLFTSDATNLGPVVQLSQGMLGNLFSWGLDDPAVSPSGARIAYLGYWSPHPYQPMVYRKLMVVDTTVEAEPTVNILPMPIGYVPVGAPSWHPNGQYLAYVAAESGKEKLIVSDLDGESASVEVGNADGSRDFDSRISFSSVPYANLNGDGQPDHPAYGKIAFAMKEAGGTYDIYIRYLLDDLGVITKIVGAPALDEKEPAISPNGQKLAYVESNAGTDQIKVCNLDFAASPFSCSGQSALTSTGNNTAPCWSFDGQYIFFTSDRDTNKEIYRMKADGTEQTNLTNNPADDFDPTCYPLAG